MSRYHQDRENQTQPITWPEDHSDPNGKYWAWQESLRSTKGQKAIANASAEKQAEARTILKATATAKDRHDAWHAVGRLLGRKL